MAQNRSPSVVFKARMLMVCLLVLTCGGCTRFDLINAVVPRCGYQRTSALSYGPLDRQKLDVYRPDEVVSGGGGDPKDPAPAAAPVVVFFYGGAWQNGSRADYRFVAQALASRGFIVVIPDYRLYPNVTFPAFVEDGAAAIRWTHDHIAVFGGDPRRLFLLGYSAGGHIAALLTLDPRYLAAVGLERGAIRATATLAGPFTLDTGGNRRGIFDVEPGMPMRDEAQPLLVAGGDAPPMLLIQGTADRVVDPTDATALARRIGLAGGDARALMYVGKGHTDVVAALVWPTRCLAPTLRDVVAFYRRVSAGIE